MIIKGSSRAGPDQLARHLQRVDTNERVEILQLDSPTGNLNEALRTGSSSPPARGAARASITPTSTLTPATR
jgi:hypothetical protein